MATLNRSSGRPHAGTGRATRKSERTRQSILDGALEFLWFRPFREMTVARLMVITGVSRPTFYQYFSGRHELMEALLGELEKDIFKAAAPWFMSEGDPIASLHRSLTGLVQVCYEQGPILRAVADASTTDGRLERVWATFLQAFDHAVATRIEQHQAERLIPNFAARPIAVALNRLDASLLIDAFGRRPRGDPGDVREALTRIWMATLYGSASWN